MKTPQHFLSRKFLFTLPIVILLLLFSLWYKAPESSNTTYPHSKLQPNEWQFRQRAYPQGQINMKAYKKALTFRKQKIEEKKSLEKDGIQDNQWEFAGPVNVGGRITDIEINNQVPKKIYAAAASGGIFTSTDEGASWTPIFDDQTSLSIGDMALAPSNEDIIYVGTGEPNAGGGSLAYDGLGVFKSTDAGNTWTALGLENVGSIGKVVVDAGDPNKVFVAAMGPLFKNSTDRGVYRSTDGGTNWQKVLFQNDSTGFIDLAIHPTQPDTLYAAAWERIRRPDRRNYGGPSSGIFRSFDGGNTWIELTMGLPTSAGRIGIAIAPSSPNILYANYTDPITNSLLGVYKSTDHGSSWSSVDVSSVADVPFMWWFGKIFVDPKDAQTVYLTSLEMFKSSDGGNSWMKIFEGAHVDQHAIGIDPDNSDKVFLGNDGGVYISSDGGSRARKSNKLPITQFYTVEIDESLPDRLYGGTQDNGTNRTLTGGLEDWSRIFGGDGFYVLVNPNDNNYVYAEAQYGYFAMSSEGGNNFVPATTGITSSRVGWNTPVVFHPHNPFTLYYGGNRLFKSTTIVPNWSPISPDLTRGGGTGNLTFGVLTTISVSPLDTQIIYTGADDGTLSVTENGGTTWNTVSGSLPDRWITRVVADSTNINGAYATFSGYRYGENSGHIYKTLNRGASWTDISGDLPDIPVNDLIQTAHDSNLYVATDIGVYFSEDEGTHWKLLGLGIPNLVITDLDYHAPSKTLVAASYGRGMYKISLIPQVAASLSSERNFIQLKASPNPVQNFVEVSFQLEKAQYLQLELIDMQGKILSNYSLKFYGSGKHSQTLNLSELPGGMYTLRLISDNHRPQGFLKLLKQ